MKTTTIIKYYMFSSNIVKHCSDYTHNLEMCHPKAICRWPSIVAMGKLSTSNYVLYCGIIIDLIIPSTVKDLIIITTCTYTSPPLAKNAIIGTSVSKYIVIELNLVTADTYCNNYFWSHHVLLWVATTKQNPWNTLIKQSVTLLK